MDYRLKREKDFNLLFKKGKRIYSADLTLIYLEADSLKAGYAVSKKHGKSVVRNKIKRILRESFRSFTPFIRQNFFFVFIPKVKDNGDYSGLRKSVEYLLKKGNFLIKENDA